MSVLTPAIINKPISPATIGQPKDPHLAHGIEMRILLLEILALVVERLNRVDLVDRDSLIDHADLFGIVDEPSKSSRLNLGQIRDHHVAAVHCVNCSAHVYALKRISLKTLDVESLVS